MVCRLILLVHRPVSIQIWPTSFQFHFVIMDTLFKEKYEKNPKIFNVEFRNLETFRWHVDSLCTFSTPSHMQLNLLIFYVCINYIWRVQATWWQYCSRVFYTLISKLYYLGYIMGLFSISRKKVHGDFINQLIHIFSKQFRSSLALDHTLLWFDVYDNHITVDWV